MPAKNLSLTGTAASRLPDDRGKLSALASAIRQPAGTGGGTSAPAFTAAPVILGNPTVGVPVSYVPGTVTGAPTPTVTRQWLLDGSAISGATGSTYTPVVGDIGTGRLSVRETATNLAGSANSTSTARDVVAAGATLTSFSLTTAATTGTKPWSIGVGLKKGDAASITTDQANCQVVIKRTWGDGTIKHAIVSGRSALTQNVPLVVQVQTGTPPSGSNLTASSIQAAAPTASVQCGGFGTVSLASLLASPVRTWVSGPEMVECHYRADVGGGTLLSVWFHVRLYADGRLWIRAIVENGYLDNGSGAAAANADRSYVPTVSVGGSNVYTNGGASLTHPRNTRWMAEGWIGGDPQVTGLHDTTYLMATKLVPNYGWFGSSGIDVDNWYDENETPHAYATAYTPMALHDIKAEMSATGFGPFIGLLPEWNAKYCTSGHAKALRSTFINASGVNHRPIVWRARGTELPPRPSDFATWSHAGPGGSGVDFLPESLPATGNWDQPHHPLEGYLAYIATGDYWYLETLAFGAASNYLYLSSARGSGTSRVMEPTQVRGVAWMMRTVGAYAAIAPTGDAVAADYRQWLENGYTHWASKIPSGSIGLGYLAILGTAPGQALRTNPWMQHFWIAVNGFLWDIEPGLSSTVNHLAVRDFMYKAIVGILGADATGSYNAVRASLYDLLRLSAELFEAGTATYYPGSPKAWYTNWGDVWTATSAALWSGISQSAAGVSLLGDDSSSPALGPWGYWANLIPAISYAVDHDAPGAVQSLSRLHDAPNWYAFWRDDFYKAPLWGITPRVSVSLPTAVNAATTIGANSMSTVVPAGITYAHLQEALLNSYGGGAQVPWLGPVGSYIVGADSGGHGHWSGWDTYPYNWAMGLHSRIAISNGTGTQANLGEAPVDNSSRTSGEPYHEMTDAPVAGTQLPAPRHSYGNLQFLRKGNKGSIAYYGGGSIGSSGNVHSKIVSEQDLENGLWSRTSNSVALSAITDQTTAYDHKRKRVYISDPNVSGPLNTYLDYFDLLANAWGRITGLTSGASFVGGYQSVFWYPPDDLVLIIKQSQIWAVRLSDNSGYKKLATTGSTSVDTGDARWEYLHGKIFTKAYNSATSVYEILTPPADGWNGTWVFSSATAAGGLAPRNPLFGGTGGRHFNCMVKLPAIGPGMLGWYGDTDANKQNILKVA